VARSPSKVSEAVLRFSREAIADGISHLSDHVECTGNVYQESDWGKRLSCWARGLELDAIVTAATPQGPANDLLGLAERHLLVDGIPVLRLRRSYDLEVWPHATRGFFKLRKAIPQVLKNQRLVDT
jgi:deoxyribodipyrimidine photo-lyase